MQTLRLIRSGSSSFSSCRPARCLAGIGLLLRHRWARWWIILLMGWPRRARRERPARTQSCEPGLRAHARPRRRCRAAHRSSSSPPPPSPWAASSCSACSRARCGGNSQPRRNSAPAAVPGCPAADRAPPASPQRGKPGLARRPPRARRDVLRRTPRRHMAAARDRWRNAHRARPPRHLLRQRGEPGSAIPSGRATAARKSSPASRAASARRITNTSETPSAFYRPPPHRRLLEQPRREARRHHHADARDAPAHCRRGPSGWQPGAWRAAVTRLPLKHNPAMPQRLPRSRNPSLFWTGISLHFRPWHRLHWFCRLARHSATCAGARHFPLHCGPRPA